jgi:hypothetical protein
LVFTTHIYIVDFPLLPIATVLTQTFFIFFIFISLFNWYFDFDSPAQNLRCDEHHCVVNTDDSDWQHVCNRVVLLLRWHKWSSVLGGTRISQLRRYSAICTPI